MSDRDLLVAALPEHLAAAVQELSELLGIGRDGWHAVPSFRRVVEIAAIQAQMDRLQRADPQLPSRVAFFLACEDLGLEADSDDDTHPADSVRRRRDLWRRAARQGK